MGDSVLDWFVFGGVWLLEAEGYSEGWLAEVTDAVRIPETEATRQDAAAQ